MTVSPQAMADAIRVLAMDSVEQANSGHPGMPMGMADVATVLWTRFLKFDARTPEWPDRDRFVLSAGHGSMLLYSLLHLTGSKAVTTEELRRFRQLHSLTPGHPEYGHTPGVETTTGVWPYSGWPGVRECSWRKRRSSSVVTALEPVRCSRE